MVLSIIFLVVLIVLGIVEWFVYDQAIWWHGGRERDPRNLPPPW